MSALPWSSSLGTGIGSLPGTDSRETARLVSGECSDFIHLHELPARGPGADMIGRTGGMLSSVSQEFSIETTPRGWRFVPNPGKDTRRAQSFLSMHSKTSRRDTQGH
jgi:hypothetical protein